MVAQRLESEDLGKHDKGYAFLNHASCSRAYCCVAVFIAITFTFLMTSE